MVVLRERPWMRRSRTFPAGICLAAMVLAGTTGVSGDAPDDLLTGTWTMNLRKSHFNPERLAPRQMTSTFTVAGGQLTAVIDGVDFGGRTIRTEYVAGLDGRDYPWRCLIDGVEDVNQDSVSWRRIDRYTYEITNKLKGSRLNTVRMVIARDGKTRTITVKESTINNTVVFERR